LRWGATPFLRDDGAIVPFFGIHIDDGGPAVDTLRHEFPDASVARREATLCAGELLRDRPEAFWSSTPWRISVTDDAGATLLVLKLEGHACAEAEVSSVGTAK
jgi:hypothetical protein